MKMITPCIKPEVIAGDSIWMWSNVLGNKINHQTLFILLCDMHFTMWSQIQCWWKETNSHLIFHLCAPPPAETQVCFRYYHGVTGALRATTPSVTIKNGSATVSLTTLHCFILTHEMCGASLVPQLPSFFIPVHCSQLCQSALVVRKLICNFSLPGYKLLLK